MRWLADRDGVFRFVIGLMALYAASDVGPGGWRVLLLAIAVPLMVIGAIVWWRHGFGKL
jgi:hypothetical protein